MSVSLWRYTESCDGGFCPGDCDQCSRNEVDPHDLVAEIRDLEAETEKKVAEIIKEMETYYGTTICAVRDYGIHFFCAEFAVEYCFGKWEHRDDPFYPWQFVGETPEGIKCFALATDKEHEKLTEH